MIRGAAGLTALLMHIDVGYWRQTMVSYLYITGILCKIEASDASKCALEWREMQAGFAPQFAGTLYFSASTLRLAKGWGDNSRRLSK